MMTLPAGSGTGSVGIQHAKMKGMYRLYKAKVLVNFSALSKSHPPPAYGLCLVCLSTLEEQKTCILRKKLNYTTLNGALKDVRRQTDGKFNLNKVRQLRRKGPITYIRLNGDF